MTVPIFTILAGSTDVTGLLGTSPTRVFPFGEAPQGVTYPYLTWQIVSGSPENYIDRTPDIDNYIIQVDIWANTGISANQVAEAVRDAIEPHAYIVSWRGESISPDTKRARVSFDISWFVNR